MELDSARTWVGPTPDEVNSHQFDELHLYGGSHLAFANPYKDPFESLDVEVGYLYGDKSGNSQKHVNFAFV